MREVRHEVRVEERVEDVRLRPGGRLAGAEDERSIGALVRDLMHDTMLLFRQEVDLAKAEVREKTSRLARNSGYVAVGGALLYAGVLTLLGAAAYGLIVLLQEMGVSDGVAFWLGPLIVGLVVAGIGYAILQKGLSTIKEEGVVPEKTVHSLQETKRWMKEKVR